MRVPIVNPLSKQDIEMISTRFLEIVQPQCLKEAVPFDVELLFDVILPQNGFETDLVELGPGIEGLTDPINSRVCVPPLTHEAMTHGDGRSRFTIVHEAGHVVLHAKQVRELMVNRGSAGLARRKDIKPYQDPEWQANTFAGAVLMPASIVKEIAAKHRNPVAAISTKLQVSTVAADIRLRNLGMK